MYTQDGKLKRRVNLEKCKKQNLNILSDIFLLTANKITILQAIKREAAVAAVVTLIYTYVVGTYVVYIICKVYIIRDK